MAQVNVSPLYQWECSRCLEENGVRWSPEIGKTLPPCGVCGKRDKCGSITEEVMPEPKNRKAAHQ